MSLGWEHWPVDWVVKIALKSECVTVFLDQRSLRSPLRELATWTLEYGCENYVYAQSYVFITLVWSRDDLRRRFSLFKLNPVSYITKAEWVVLWFTTVDLVWLLYLFLGQGIV
jgi:hypothetical protein